MRKYVFVLWISGAMLLLASCSRRAYPTNDPYPNGRYPAPNDRPVVIYEPGWNLPPGQAKKVYGDRNARGYAPGQRKKYCPAYGQRGYPLIIIRTPDIVLGRTNDGRYYHRNRDGLFYWLMGDNRFYLDQQYIPDVQYDEDEYRNWQRIVQPRQRYGNRDDDDNDDRRERRGRGHGRGKHHD